MIQIKHDNHVFRIKFSYATEHKRRICIAALYGEPENFKDWKNSLPLETATSVCHPNDLYDKCKGRTMALDRMTQNIDRGLSRKIWETYLETCKTSSFSGFMME